MTKYMLITVCEREIETRIYNSFKDAYAQMIVELEEEFERLNDIDEWDALNVENWVAKNGTYQNEYYQFGIGKDWAWSNIDEDWKHDWKIVEIN